MFLNKLNIIKNKSFGGMSSNLFRGGNIAIILRL